MTASRQRLGQGMRRMRVHTAKDGTKSYTWRVTWGPGPGGNESKTFAKDSDGRAWAHALAATKARHGTTATGTETVGGIYERWINVHTGRPNTIRNHRSDWRLHIAPTFATTPLRDLTHENLKRWIKDQYATAAVASTAGKHIDTLAAILGAAVAFGELAANPLTVRGMRPRVQQDPVVVPESDEVLAMIGALTPRFAILAVLAAGLGLRYGEAAGLTVPNIDLLRREFRIVRQAQRLHDADPRHGEGAGWVLDPLKGAKARIITREVDDFVIDGVAAHLARFPATSAEQFITASPSGSPIGSQAFARAWSRERERLGLPATFKFHGLRHYHASALIDAGWRVARVARRLGDSIRVTEQTYLHLFDRQPEQDGRGAIEAALFASSGSLDTSHGEVAHTSAHTGFLHSL